MRAKSYEDNALCALKSYGTRIELHNHARARRERSNARSER